MMSTRYCALSSVPKLLDYYTVERAASGDEDAIRVVINFFSATITQKSARLCIDDCGNRRFYTDPFVRGHIEGRLMEAIVKFPIDK